MREVFPTAASPETVTKESLVAKGWSTISTLEVVIGNCIKTRNKHLLLRLLEEQNLSGEERVLVAQSSASYTYYSPRAQVKLAEQLKEEPKYRKYSSSLDIFITDLQTHFPEAK